MPIATGCAWHHDSEQTYSVPNLLGHLAPTMTSPPCVLGHLASTRQMRLELSAAGATQEINTKNLLRAKVRMRKMMRLSLCHRELTTRMS